MSENIFSRRPDPAHQMSSKFTGPALAAAARLSQKGGAGHLGGPPIALARPNIELAAQAPSVQQVTKLLASYKGKSVGQFYRGPGWVDANGLPWVIVVSANAGWPRAARHAQRFGLITWRWNIGPSAPVSLTVVVHGYRKLSNPAPRWFAGSHAPVMKAIRQLGRFMVMLAQPGGVQSGWLLAEFDPIDDSGGFGALQRQFTQIPTPGIEGSRLGERFHSIQKSTPNDEREDEIALWPEQSGDYWATMGYKGPWDSDLQHIDRIQAKWGSRLMYKRGQAAGAIELLRDRHVLDGERPFFNADGSPTSRITGTTFDGLSKAAEVYPGWARLAAAVAGPAPNAATAFDAAIACLCDPHNCSGLVSVGLTELPEIDDEHLMPAVKLFTECALLAPQVTQEGLAKPWLANSGDGLVLKTTPLELSADVEDVQTYWRQGLELHEIIDSGLWARGADLPYPLGELGKRMAGTSIEGGIEAAENRTMALLSEAVDARQWSIPWGAHVELAVGPFVGLHIYEVQGEFSCLFLDERGRYYHVAIGLRKKQPQFCSSRFLKPLKAVTPEHQLADWEDDESEEKPQQRWDWDDYSQVALQLIAAAIVRDFLVVEERESVFGSRAATRRVPGRKVRTVVYLPRVSYHHPAVSAKQFEPEMHIPAVRTRHAVTQHLRKVGTPSATQRFLAQSYGVQIPEGFTFVRPHERGAAASEDRIRVYRSRSASRMLFEVVETAPAGTRPAWFDFEKDCAKVLRWRDLVVRHQAAQRDGDGGVDLYATDKVGQGWVIQCKCWGLHRPVGPDVVRELHGAIAKADIGGAVASRGILITTSRFTSGAIALARTFGYECIDGPAFAKLVAV